MMGFSTFLPALILRSLDLEEPNKLIGYRTPWSLKSAETWRYANKKSGDLLLWGSIGIITVQISTFFLIDAKTSILITAGCIVISVAFSMIATEIGLRKLFDKDGKPKKPIDNF